MKQYIFLILLLALAERSHAQLAPEHTYPHAAVQHRILDNYGEVYVMFDYATNSIQFFDAGHLLVKTIPLTGFQGTVLAEAYVDHVSKNVLDNDNDLELQVKYKLPYDGTLGWGMIRWHGERWIDENGAVIADLPGSTNSDRDSRLVPFNNGLKLLLNNALYGIPSLEQESVYPPWQPVSFVHVGGQDYIQVTSGTTVFLYNGDYEVATTLPNYGSGLSPLLSDDFFDNDAGIESLYAINFANDTARLRVYDDDGSLLFEKTASEPGAALRGMLYRAGTTGFTADQLAVYESKSLNSSVVVATTRFYDPQSFALEASLPGFYSQLLETDLDGYKLAPASISATLSPDLSVTLWDPGTLTPWKSLSAPAPAPAYTLDAVTGHVFNTDDNYEFGIRSYDAYTVYDEAGNVLAAVTGAGNCALSRLPGAEPKLLCSEFGATRVFALPLPVVGVQTPALAAPELIVMPNPTTGPALVAFRQPITAECSIQVYDALGRLAGTLRAPVGATRVEVPAAVLQSPGLYTAYVQRGAERRVLRIVKR